MNPVDLRLYLVTDSEGMSDAVFLHKVEAALRGGVTLLQLREKTKEGRDFYKLACKVKALARRYNVPLLIDDRIDIALAVGAAGVHVGQSDIPVEVARALLGEDKIIGATAKTVEQARIACVQGADYLGVGAIYPTTTKVKTVRTKVETLAEITCAVPIPIVAIGGLHAGNIEALRGSGAAGIAVVSALMKQDDPETVALQLRAAVKDILQL